MIIKRIASVLIVVFSLGLLVSHWSPTQAIVLFQDSEIRNSIKNKIRTGNNNSQGDTTIKTGDGTNTSIITNIVNNVTIDCCITPSPSTKPTDSDKPTPTPDPGNPTPTNTPNGGGGNGGNGDGGNGGGGNNGGGLGGGDVSGASAQQGEILGLATTSGNNITYTLIQIVGLLCLGTGLLLKKGRG